VSVNLKKVGEHLLGRAVDLDAALDHGFDPLLTSASSGLPPASLRATPWY
jgi:hypothetical protein